MRSFARTGGRLTAAEASALAEHGHSYLLGANSEGYVESLHPEHLNPSSVFDDEAAPLVIEIGSGMGDQLVSFAVTHPESNLLGVEVWRQGLAGTVARAVRAEVNNVRLVQADAATLVNVAVPEGCADEIWTFFPDPWPKLRHRKRRLVSAQFAAGVARVLRPGGVWRLATDWEDYALQMREVLADTTEFVADPLADAHGFSPRWAGRVLTRYERRGLAAGREVRDLMVTRR